MMKKYIIKTRIRNIRYEMVDYEYSYSVGELEPFYQRLGGCNLNCVKACS